MEILEIIFKTGDPNVFDRDAYSKVFNFKEFDALCDLIKPEHIVNRRILDSFKKGPLNRLETKKIVVIMDKGEYIEVEYPNLFLQWGGDELNSPCKEKPELDIKSLLLDNLRKMCTNLKGTNDPLYIPLDLAESFFDLSTKVREHIREIIGKKKGK